MQIQRVGAQFTPKLDNHSSSHAQNLNFKGNREAEIFKITFEETLRILNGNFKKSVNLTAMNLRKIFKPESCELKPRRIGNGMNHYFKFKTSPESEPITIMYNTTKKHTYIEYHDPNLKNENSHIIFSNSKVIEMPENPYNKIAS